MGPQPFKKFAKNRKIFQPLSFLSPYHQLSPAMKMNSLKSPECHVLSQNNQSSLRRGSAIKQGEDHKIQDSVLCLPVILSVYAKRYILIIQYYLVLHQKSTGDSNSPAL